MTRYQFSAEKFGDTWAEIETIYRQHYGEMIARLAGLGHPISPFNCRKDYFVDACENGHLLHFVARLDGAAVGYLNVSLSNDLLNGDFVAWEAGFYVLPDHRNGVGRRLMASVIEHLRGIDVVRLHGFASTDLRVEKLWRRMGFLPTAQQMTLHL